MMIIQCHSKPNFSMCMCFACALIFRVLSQIKVKKTFHEGHKFIRMWFSSEYPSYIFVCSGMRSSECKHFQASIRYVKSRIKGINLFLWNFSHIWVWRENTLWYDKDDRFWTCTHTIFSIYWIVCGYRYRGMAFNPCPGRFPSKSTKPFWRIRTASL